MKNDLEIFRERINNIDENIVNLIVDRMRISEMIGQYKKENNISVVDNTRFKKVKENVFNQLNNVCKKYHYENNFNILKTLLERIYNNIHETSCNLQNLQK